MTIIYNEKFIEAFAKHSDQYVIIGGTATAIQLARYNISSRVTKDYDMVIVDEKKDKEFYNTLVKFLEEGEYNSRTLDNKKQLFRFITKKSGYPAMIELFSKYPMFNLAMDNAKTPVQFDEDSSLSAILLDDEYYRLLINNIENIDGYSVLSTKALIIFKAKAWLDLSKRKTDGHKVDSRDIKKHLADIVRLIGSLEDLDMIQDIHESVLKDMRTFLQQINEDIIPENKELGLEKNQIISVLIELLG